jgi:HK97 family phage major capsid protein
MPALPSRRPDPIRAPVFKSGAQSADDPFEFVMATDDVDRYGDIIDIDGVDLAGFERNPVALWNHDSTSPIGTWSDVRRVGGELRGRLDMAARGTSSLIDRVRALIEQRIIRAVSVGFLPRASVALKATGGLRYTATDLMECSVVAIPANANALRIKGLTPDPLDALIFSGNAPPLHRPPVVSRAWGGTAAQPRAPLSSAPSGQGPGTMHPTPISQKIVQLQARSIAIDDQLSAIQAAAEADDGRTFTDDETAQITALGEEKDNVVRSINSNVAIERALAVRAVPTSQAPTVPATVRTDKAGDIIVKMMASLALAHQTRRSVDQACGDLYRDDERVKAALDWLTRSATEVATTTRPGWAAELVTEGTGQFLAEIMDVSVYQALASRGTTLEFGNNGSLVVPRRAQRGTLAGAFVGETGVIPVKQGELTSDLFERYKLAVISTFSKELENLSTPAIERVVRESITNDTTELIDNKLLSNLAQRPGVRPAGLLFGITPTASSGNTPANVNTDLKALLGGLDQRQKVVIIMHPDRALGLSLMTTATGDYIFRDEINGDGFFGTSTIISENVPNTTVIAVNAADFATGNGTPAFDLSDTATLTMANADVTPPTQAVKADGTLDIAEEVGVGLGISVAGGPAGAGTAGFEAVSMFQTWSTALRMVLPISWGMMRAGSVTALSGVNW